MINCYEINSYIEWCENHPKKVNKRRKKLIKNIVKPLLNREDILFDEPMYRKCIAYCEKKYFSLMPYQKFIYAFVFMWYEDGSLVFPKLFLFMGRGNGKTSGMMPLMDFLTTPLYGVKNYNIDIVANSEKQAIKDFNIIYDKLEEGAQNLKRMWEWTKTHIINKQTHSEIRYNTSNASTKDGGEGGCVLFDEVHGYQNMDQVNVFTSQQGKQKDERVVYITTNGYVREGALDKLLELMDKILDTGNIEYGYFPFLCCLDSEDEINDKEAWEKANPSLPFLKNLQREMKTAYLEALEIAEKMIDFIAKRMNLITGGVEEGVAPWDEILATNQPIPYDELIGKDCIGGCDYANTNDFVGCCLIFNIDGKAIVLHHSFICKKSRDLKGIKAPYREWEKRGICEVIDDVEIQPELIATWFENMAKKYNIKRIVYDSYRYSLLGGAFKEHGFISPTSKEERKMLENSDTPIVDLSRRREVAINSPVITSMFANKKIVVGDDPMFRWYSNNVLKKIGKEGNVTYDKIEPHYRKTDGFMAFVNAMTRFRFLEEKQESVGIVYDIPTLVF